MSWHFSQALEVAFLAAGCSDGAPCAPWNSTPFAPDDSCSDRMKDTLHHSPFGMMFVPSTDCRGAALLTWFRAGFPVRTLVRPEPAQDSMASEVDSGPKWRGSFAKWNPKQLRWKTAQCSLLGDSDEFLETWPRWGSMRNGASYLRPIPALPICESASGLWQTPVADDAISRLKGKWNSRGEPKLSAQVMNWPTPRARDAQPEGLEAGLRRVEKYSTCGLSTAVNADPSAKKTGLLNPNWTEWLMGWPIGWTGCEPLETAKFQEWLQQHGRS